MSADDHHAPSFDDADSGGFDAGSVPLADLAVAIVDGARQWADFLDAVIGFPSGMDDLRLQPEVGEHEWSAIEYACHVRDVISLCARRVELALLSHNPTQQPWDAAQAARDEHYREQHPHAVADDIVRCARELANLLQPLTPSAWERESTLDGERVHVSDLARSALHELRHHLDHARSVVPAPTA